MVTVVGIGPGHPDYITPAATRCIAEAELIVGGKRALEIVNGAGKELYEITADLRSAIKIIDDNKDRKVAVLVSGDPGFYSLLKTIREKLPQLSIDVVPGISSMQILFSLIAREWQDVAFTSVHGRAIEDLNSIIKMGKAICLLTDDKITAPVVGRYLTDLGISGRAVVGENLSYPNQVLIDTTIDKLAKMDGLSSSVLFLEIGDR